MAELAFKTGFAKSYISSIERGIQSNPTIHFVERVASELGVSIYFLMQGATEEESRLLDKDWVVLVVEAMNYGLSKQEFREYLEMSNGMVRKGVNEFVSN